MSLFVVRCSSVSCFSLVTVSGLWFVVCSVLVVGCWLLVVVICVLFLSSVVCCSLFVVVRWRFLFEVR